MLRTILRAAAALVFAAFPFSFADAEDAGKQVDAVAPEVAQVISGGSWSADKKGGFYRAIVVMAGDGKGAGALVYLQWLAFGDTPIPVIVKSLPIKEVNDQKLENASIDIVGEEDKENEITLVITSYDIAEDEDISLFVKASEPGKYSMTKDAPEGTLPPEDEPAKGKEPGKGEAPGIED